MTLLWLVRSIIVKIAARLNAELHEDLTRGGEREQVIVRRSGHSDLHLHLLQQGRVDL